MPARGGVPAHAQSMVKFVTAIFTATVSPVTTALGAGDRIRMLLAGIAGAAPDGLASGIPAAMIIAATLTTANIYRFI